MDHEREEPAPWGAVPAGDGGNRSGRQISEGEDSPTQGGQQGRRRRRPPPLPLDAGWFLGRPLPDGYWEPAQAPIPGELRVYFPPRHDGVWRPAEPLITHRQRTAAELAIAPPKGEVVVRARPVDGHIQVEIETRNGVTTIVADRLTP
jgi:hypothetical protein